MMKQGFLSLEHVRALTLLMTGSVLAAMPHVALAQTNPGAGEEAGEREAKSADGQQLDDIIVTARRVDESIQRVPVAVTALGETAIREKGITNTTEVMFNAPSVQMTTQYGRLSGGFAVRGLAGGTQVYFAEIPGGPTESSAPLFDISSVQVLNGPQGTLFGRANTAGAVLVTPNRPALDAVGGNVQFTVGNLGMNRATAVLNLPLVKNELAIRFAVNRTHLNGNTKALGTSLRLNEDNSHSARVSLEWRPGDGSFRTYSVFDVYDVNQAPTAMILSAINTSLPIFNLPGSISAPGGLAAGTATFGTACNAAVAAGIEGSLESCIDRRLQIAATFRPAMEAEFARTQQGGDAIRSWTARDDWSGCIVS